MLTGTIHKKAADWVARVIQICQPDAVHWCDGSEDEHKKLCEILVNKGIYTKLSDEKRKNSYLARVPEEDLQRLDDRTYICSEKEEDAGTPASSRYLMVGSAPMMRFSSVILPSFMGTLKSQRTRTCLPLRSLRSFTVILFITKPSFY